jgi:hypothetical protein
VSSQESVSYNVAGRAFFDALAKKYRIVLIFSVYCNSEDITTLRDWNKVTRKDVIDNGGLEVSYILQIATEFVRDDHK